MTGFEIQEKYEEAIIKNDYKTLDSFVDTLKEVFEINELEADTFEDDAFSEILNAVMRLGEKWA